MSLTNKETSSELYMHEKYPIMAHKQVDPCDSFFPRWIQFSFIIDSVVVIHPVNAFLTSRYLIAEDCIFPDHFVKIGDV